MTHVPLGVTAIAVLGGAAIGFFGGIFAVGGALIAIPLLVFLDHQSQHAAQGTAMLMAISSAASTLFTYWRSGWIRWTDGWALALCCWIAGTVSAHLVAYVPDRALGIVFGIFLALLGSYEIVKGSYESTGDGRVGLGLQIPLGLVAGVLSGFFVIGGALVAVPLLRRFAALGQRESQGLALLALVPTSIVGCAEYARAGNVDWNIALPLAVGSLFASSAGAALGGRLPQTLLARGFAVLQVLAGLALALA
jgi:uncharacterized protein